MSPSRIDRDPAGAAGAGRAASPPAFEPAEARRRFPALRAAGDRELFFDNAAGAQVPDEVVDAVREHYVERNLQRGGRYARSRAVDGTIDGTRALLRAFLNAAAPEEIVFGLNATSLIRAVADAVRPRIGPGDRVVVTELDHEANVGPWLRLESAGAVPRVWKARGRDARLDPEDLRALLREGGGPVRLVAMPLASNATGRIVDVAAAAAIARDAGALVFVDAVHYGPHGPIDAPSLGADFLAFSGYKIFGPHMGFLWGRAASLASLAPAREFFIPAEAPYAYEPGTQTYEGIAGMGGALRYLASWGPEGTEPRARLRGAMERIRAYEIGLGRDLVRGLGTVPGLRILGESDPERASERVPTVCFTIEGRRPEAIVERLAARGIHARDGHMYAPRALTAAGIDPDPGVVRVSLCHYNDAGEIDRLVAELRALG
ncbi:MAG: cysteine desulfurase-like protein [Hyphomicrobiales bacterium]